MTKAMLIGLAAAAFSATASAQFAPERCPEDGKAGSLHGCYYWEVPDTDCLPGNELGNCSDTHGPPYTMDECKTKCRETGNCGGFNLPNGHLKKMGCFEEMQPWPALAPSDAHPNGRHALTIYVLNQYPPKRTYWWEVEQTTCNNRHNELGNCTMTNPIKNPTPAQKREFDEKYRNHCKKVCTENPFCEGFNLPFGHLKAVGCKHDLQPHVGGKVTLYYMRGRPQSRPAANTVVTKQRKGLDCEGGFELGNCSSYLGPPYTVSECSEACLRNPLCGGFNLPNGHLKTQDCPQYIEEDAKDPGVKEFYLITPKE